MLQEVTNLEMHMESPGVRLFQRAIGAASDHFRLCTFDVKNRAARGGRWNLYQIRYLGMPIQRSRNFSDFQSFPAESDVFAHLAAYSELIAKNLMKSSVHVLHYCSDFHKFDVNLKSPSLSLLAQTVRLWYGKASIQKQKTGPRTDQRLSNNSLVTELQNTRCKFARTKSITFERENFPKYEAKRKHTWII